MANTTASDYKEFSLGNIKVYTDGPGVLFTWDTKNLESLRVDEQHIIFVVDKSSSMTASLRTNQADDSHQVSSSRLMNLLGSLQPTNRYNTVSRHSVVEKSLQKALKFISTVNSNSGDKISCSLISFNNESEVHFQDKTIDSDFLAMVESNLHRWILPCGSTNFMDVINICNNVAKTGKETDNRLTSVFFLSDGFDTYSTDKDKLNRVVEDFSRTSNIDNCVCIGIGREDEYDVGFLSKICRENKLFGVKTSSEANDEIVGTCFGACSIVAKNVTFTFPESDILTPLDVVDNKIQIESFSFSQQIPIFLNIEPQNEVIIGVTYEKDGKHFKYKINLPNSTNNNSKIRTLCEVAGNYARSFDQNISRDEHIKIVEKCVSDLEGWQKSDRVGSPLRDMWDEYETQIKNHMESVKNSRSENHYRSTLTVSSLRSSSTLQSGQLSGIAARSSDYYVGNF